MVYIYAHALTISSNYFIIYMLCTYLYTLFIIIIVGYVHSATMTVSIEVFLSFYSLIDEKSP